MARETKIGVALMVLLVGVFGFIVYKKWNDRRPTALAAAAESADSKSKPETAPAETPKATPAPAESNPFASAASTAPPAQVEPGSSVAEPSRAGKSVPVRQVSAVAESSPFEQSEPVPQSEPVAQTEPAASEPAEGEFVPIRQNSSASVEPFSRATPSAAATAAEAKAESPAVEEDPFGTAATSAATAATTAEPATAKPEPVAPEPLTRATDDAFGQPGATAAASPTPTDDPFGSATSAEVSETETAKTDATATADVAVKPQPDADPFSGTPESPKKVEAAAATPEASAPVAEASPTPVIEDDPFGSAAPGKADPLAETASAVLEQPTASAPPENVFEPAATPARLGEPVAEPTKEAAEPSAGPFGQPAPPPDHAERTGYSLVEENDSYWAISKRVYGTPAYFHALAKYNETRIPDPKRLRPGMKVLTPPPDELTRRFPSLVTAAASSGPPQDAGAAGLFTDERGRPAYRVGPDDTLGKIAQTHLGRASRWVQIYEMNRDVVPNAKVLKPGTVLKLPGDASRVRLVPDR